MYFYNVTNEDFFNRFASPASIGLVGGTAFIDKTIIKAQKKITPDKKPALFSHAFLIGEKRMDDKWWVIESDLEFHRKQIKLGVQENRLDKYFDENLFPNVAILDFKLAPTEKKSIINEGLELVSGRAKYSLREILGVFLSFTKETRNTNNPFAQENSFICSALVQHCYSKANICFNNEVSLKHITPFDIYSTKLEHAAHKILREEY